MYGFSRKISATEQSCQWPLVVKVDHIKKKKSFVRKHQQLQVMWGNTRVNDSLRKVCTHCSAINSPPALSLLTEWLFNHRKCKVINILAIGFGNKQGSNFEKLKFQDVGPCLFIPINES